MEVRNCNKCGKIFNYVTGPSICQGCRKNLEEVFTVVRKYVRRNPQSTIPEIAEECDTDIKQIRQWIREERLSFTSDSDVGIECEQCGVSIKTGRYCEACKKAVTENLDRAYEKAPPKPEMNKFRDQKKDTKMRFLNKNDV
ncbi:MAG: flagellar protein [Vallitaleaceae bacterium]|jgi:predicted  nucleic acid-binding Zn-ribbon protein|nr:flagellar protein [Vallitaleaceae bacterium]